MQSLAAQTLQVFGKSLPYLRLAALVFVLASVTFAEERSAALPDASLDASDAKPTIRPNDPPTPSNPEELQRRPDGEGKLQFNFHGQPWLGVLEWLAEVSNLSLDWQELPAGFLNLRTRHSYAVEEARDLINRHLLDRGFTLLKHGEILSIANTKKLDPSLVPHLAPDELESALPHEFVRVTFALDSLTAEAAVEELKALVSPNGKLIALKSTNRVEAMDAAVNLREIQKLLMEEQSPRGRDRLVREFKLEHVRAAEIYPQLQKLLGLDKANAAQGSDPAAIVQQMAQLLQKGGAAPGPNPQQKQQGPSVQIVVNARDNSILANAPADQMAVIAQAILVMDSPPDKSRSLLRSAHRVQVYPLAVTEPEALIKMLQELGDLDPTTRLQVDKKRRAIVAHASLADHLTIRTMIDKVDGTVRNFHAIKLHRLDADYVASSIDMVVGGGNAEAAKRTPGRENDDEVRRFRVVADVEHNRLLLWVNDVELREVRQLLGELGETPAADTEPASVRVLDNLAPAEAHDLFRRLQEAWPGVAPNPLELGPGTNPGSKSPVTDRDTKNPASGDIPAATERPSRTDPAPDDGSRRPRTSTKSPSARTPVRFVHLAGSNDPANQSALRAAEATETESVPDPVIPGGPSDSPSSAPVRVDRDADGRLIVASRDVAALDLMKKLIGEMAPLHKDFKVFRMKHKNSWPYQIAENLKQFFDEKQKAERPAARFYDPSNGKTIDTSRPGEGSKQQKPRQPKFIVDSDSNSILAVGANNSQLETIEELIELYDTPESKDPQPRRVTRLIKIEHTQARLVGDAVKDVYRDLLSMTESRDRGDSSRDRRISEPRYTYVYNAVAEGRELPETLVKFKGQLSIGVDESSNSLIVSAPEALLEDVAETVTAIDEAARAATPRIQVVRVSRSVNAGELQKRLQKLLTKPQPQQQSATTAVPAPPHAPR
jgi:type II secretory pathway component GspD/PulD (secretin)